MKKAMRVLIGFDGSSASNAVFQDLQRAGLPKHVEAVVLTAVDISFLNSINMSTPYPAESVPVMDLAKSRVMERVQETAETAASRLRKIFPSWRIYGEGDLRSPTSALVKKAKDWKADLVVVGARGHSRIGRFLGSTSQLVLIQAPCSVRVARASLKRYGRKEPRNILGIDGSADSINALNMVKNRNWPAAAHFQVVSAVSRRLPLQLTHGLPPDYRGKRMISGAARKALNEMLESFAVQLRAKEMSATTYVREGDAAKILIGEAKAWRASCVFVGARGLSATRRMFLGSVSLAVAARAHCSVEIVRLKG